MKKKALKKSGPKNADEKPEPIARNDFEDALRKASRKVSRSDSEKRNDEKDSDY